ncbi:MAG: hypothetical protein CVV27_02275 [Candidatus Melainabacteria bacterium HGW-Melainabacteria-1]|nr:MAG: hypothetical protein CVV27_02275 [Candidatus Melainabacteria bacterium HGW-Melainabacteria-1]
MVKQQTSPKGHSAKKSPKFRPGQLAGSRLPRRALLLILLLLIAWAISAYLNRSGSVSGQVLNATGTEALQNVKLTLDQSKTQQIGELTSTFVFLDLKPGKHTLTAEAPGYKAQTTAFELKAGESRRLSLTLSLVSEQEAFKGDAWLIGSYQPAALLILSPEFNELKKIPLRGRPTDVVLRGNTAFVADETQDLVQIVDLKTSENRDVKLPPKSEPSRLALSGNQLTILNNVGKSIYILNLSTMILQPQPLRLPFSPRDMATDGAELYVLGPEILAAVNLSLGTIDRGFALPGVNAHQLHKQPASSSFILLGNKQLYQVDPRSGDTKTIPLTQGAERIAVLDLNTVMLASQDRLQRFDLIRREVASTQRLEGKVTYMAEQEGVLVVATTAPNRLLFFDAGSMQLKQSLNMAGIPAFARKVRFD